VRRRSVVPWLTTAFFALTFVVFTFVEPYLAAVNNPNENTRTYLTMAIVEHHTFHLDEIVQRHGWIGDMGRVNEKLSSEDPAARAKTTLERGRAPRPVQKSFYMSVKAPATSYFGVPVYWAFTKIAPRLGHPVPTERSPPAERAWWLRTVTFTLRLFTVQLPCFGFLVWFERWLRRTTDDIVLRLAAVAAVAFGSNFLAYAMMYVSHATSAVAAFLAFGLTFHARLDSLGDSRRRGVRSAFVVGLLSGMVPVLEYTGLPVGLFLALYGLVTFRRPAQLAALTIGGVIDVVGLTFYQARACESWKTPCPKFAEGYAWLHTKTFGFGKPSWEFMKDASLSHSSGFFGMSPFMWLGLLAIPFGVFAAFGTRIERRERRAATLVWMATMLALWVFVSAASNPHGGWSIGPRYLGAAPPFFAFGAAVGLESIARRSRAWRVIARTTAVGLLLASAVQVGFISLVYNSVTDTTLRPLARFAVPLVWAGFTPHHVGELLGWNTTTCWYFVVACLVAAVGLLAVSPARDTAWSWTVRIVGAIAIATYAILPAFEPIPVKEVNDEKFPAYLVSVWEPAGRDRLTKIRAQAELHGAAHPCLWYRVADFETALRMDAEAARDERRATVRRSACP